jgi:chaperonin cofactor prefoldin
MKKKHVSNSALRKRIEFLENQLSIIENEMNTKIQGIIKSMEIIEFRINEMKNQRIEQQLHDLKIRINQLN